MESIMLFLTVLWVLALRYPHGIHGSSGSPLEAMESKAVAYVSNRSFGTTLVQATESHSQIGCLTKVNFQKNPCYVIEVKHIGTSQKWSCKIFTSTEDDTQSRLDLVSDRESTVYTVHQRSSKCKPPIKPPQVTSCLDLLKRGTTSDGVYDIQINGKRVSVFCDMTTQGGGWTLFQKRVDGSEDFSRDWNDYVQGFGDPATNYWLGLENIHQMTTSVGDSPTSVMLQGVVGEGIGTAKIQINYDFSVGNNDTNYVIRTGFSNICINCNKKHFTKLDGMEFTTKDVDNDRSKSNCANLYNSGWWYDDCYDKLNPNGIYESTTNLLGIAWEDSFVRKISLALRREEGLVEPRP